MCDRRAQSEHLGHFAEKKIDRSHGNDQRLRWAIMIGETDENESSE